MKLESMSLGYRCQGYPEMLLSLTATRAWPVMGRKGGRSSNNQGLETMLLTMCQARPDAGPVLGVPSVSSALLTGILYQTLDISTAALALSSR